MRLATTLCFALVIIHACLLQITLSVEVLELQGIKFELALSSHRYLAVLFYDNSEQGKELQSSWTEQAESLESIPEYAALAKVRSVLTVV